MLSQSSSESGQVVKFNGTEDRAPGKQIQYLARLTAQKLIHSQWGRKH